MKIDQRPENKGLKSGRSQITKKKCKNYKIKEKYKEKKLRNELLNIKR